MEIKGAKKQIGLLVLAFLFLGLFGGGSWYGVETVFEHSFLIEECPGLVR